MVDDGRVQSYWDSWFADVDANWTGDKGLMIPVVPCLGNHESNSTNYYEQFALPGNEQWFYYDWGPTLRIIVLNSEAFDSQIQTDQVTWLHSVLSQTPENMWKIVMFHRNIYYAGGHTDERNLRDYWVPLFDRYHVDIVVQGHSHLYHRTKPMNDSLPVYSYREGTMYLTAGGWGAPLHTYYNQSYSAYGSSAYHFVLASVFKNGSLHLEVKEVNGQTFDSVWLHSKTKYWDFPNGMHLMSLGADITLPPLLTDDNLTVTTNASKGTISTLKLYCGTKGSPLNVTGVSSWVYDNGSKILTLTILHSNATVSVKIIWVNPTNPGSRQASSDGALVVMIALISAALVVLGVFTVSQLSIRKSNTLRRPE
jgi:hypothetical protein